MSWWCHTYLPDLWQARYGRPLAHKDEELETTPPSMEEMLVSPADRREYEEWIDSCRKAGVQCNDDSNANTPSMGKKE